jgi:MFS family permease
MTKLQELKQAMQNPPPERLARIEYRSHFFQMLGISVVCLFLILKGFWYIIFAFIFGIGISYSQGMTAYAKYRAISALLKPEDPKDFMNDPSITRKRTKIINYAFGSIGKWASIVIAVFATFVFIPVTTSRWTMVLAYFITIPLFFVLMYFFFFYWVALYYYKRRIKF